MHETEGQMHQPHCLCLLSVMECRFLALGDTGAFVDAWTAVHPEVCACVACISCPVTFVAFSCDMPYDAMC
eukprot:m.404695 g.404695  ORF g.404695 m.404695 type:complete len:71 (+) comp21200_c0_seq3:174-386(+)